MRSFSEQMNHHQVEWRRCHVTSKESGSWRKRPYPWILPADLWEEGLWPGIRTGSDNALQAYLEQSQVQKHSDVHNLKSSWILCANLYFPFRTSCRDRGLLGSFLRHRVAPQVESLNAIELEFSEDGELHPSRLLGESGGRRGAGQTSPDLGLLVNGGHGLVLVESKFTERDFSRCSARKRKGSAGRPGNPDPERCDHALAVAQDPCSQCHQAVWGRRYWEHLTPAANQEVLAALPCCPAARGGYQLLRQSALAEGIARSGKYDLTASAVAVDARNTDLIACLKKSGIPDLSRWASVFGGRATFAVFTHQQWVGWVKEHDREDRWRGWLTWIGDRYGI